MLFLVIFANAATLELSNVPKLEPLSGAAHPVTPMALDQAVQVVTKLPVEIRKMLDNKKVAAAQTRSNLRKKAAGDPVEFGSDDPSAYSSGGIGKLTDKINALIEETDIESDHAFPECDTFTTTTKGP